MKTLPFYLPAGVYRHYKGQHYLVLGYGRMSDGPNEGEPAASLQLRRPRVAGNPMTTCAHEWDWSWHPAICRRCGGAYFGIALNDAKAGEIVRVDMETPAQAAERILRLADERPGTP